MRTIYLRKEYPTHIRKVLIDMAYLVSHKKIRLIKTYYEEGLFLPYLPSLKDKEPKVEKYFLTKDKIKSESSDFYFFDFPFKPEQVEPVAE